MTTGRRESELLTPGEAAVELRTTAATVKRWLRDGRLPGVRTPGGEWRVAIDDLRGLHTQQIRNHHRRRDAGTITRGPV